MRRAVAAMVCVSWLLAGCAATVVGQGAELPARAGSAVSAPSPGRSPAPLRSAPQSLRSTAPARPASNPCRDNQAAKLVRVSVASQHLWLCAFGQAAYDAAVTTGIPTEDFHTPTGRYVIQAKGTEQTLTLLTGDRYVVRYWIPFDAPLFGFHDAAWQAFPFGSQRYRTDGSHGCVHMPLAAIATLYRWAPVGTPVVIA